MQPNFLDSTPQGDGTCTRCAEPVQTIEFNHRRYTPKVCSPCREKANREAEIAAGAAVVAVRDDRGIRPRFEHCSFDNYVANGNARALDLCRVYADAFPPATGDGLCLHGGYGTGKTHLAVAVGRAIAGSYVMNCAELLAAIRASFDGATAGPGMWERCMTAPLLVLDDVGQEKGTAWVWEQLYILINRRYEALLPTIFTTNLRPEQWSARWGGAIASRIMGMSTIIELKGIDYRTKKR